MFSCLAINPAVAFLPLFVAEDEATHVFRVADEEQKRGRPVTPPEAPPTLKKRVACYGPLFREKRAK